MHSDERRSQQPGDERGLPTRDALLDPERDSTRDTTRKATQENTRDTAQNTARAPSPEPSREGDVGPGLDDLLGVLLHESTLWPLLIVIVASFGALGAGLVVLSVVDRNPFAAGALILMLGMTLDLLWRSRRRPGLRNLARGVGVIWLAALGLAGLAVWVGIA